MRYQKGIITACIELCKPRISLFAAFSAASGFVISAAEIRQQILFLIAGVFVLASGAGALNQYQEQTTDALMTRTKTRPIPSGRIKPRRAFYFSVALIFLGLTTLSLAEGMTVPLLGLSAVIWYNGVYTYLKRKTAFASVPGALVGAVPPAMGSIAAGGHLGDPAVLYLCLFFFIWQVPHFWLLIADHGEEYRRAGLPSLTQIFTRNQFTRVIFNWILATAVSCIFIAAAGVILSSLISLLILGFSLWLVWSATELLRNRRRESSYNVAFRRINVYMLLVMALLSVNKLLF